MTKYYPPPRRGVFGLRDLFKDFFAVRQTELALDDLYFSIGEGELFGLLGPNGAGKTTFCKILNALVIPTHGNITIDGLDTIKHHRRLSQQIVPVFTGDVDMYMFFMWRLSIERNLEFMAKLWRVPRNKIKERVEYTLEISGLADRRKEWFQRLSSGLKQRVYLSLPLLIQPKVVILDEPTVHLDVLTRKGVHIVVRKILVDELGSTVILTTHDMEEADKLCDRVAVLNKGQVIALDRPSKLKSFKTHSFEVLLVRLQNPRPEVISELDKIKDIDKCQLQRISDGVILKLFFVDIASNLKKIIDILNEHGTIIDLRLNPTKSLEDSFMQLITNQQNRSSV